MNYFLLPVGWLITLALVDLCSSSTGSTIQSKLAQPRCVDDSGHIRRIADLITREHPAIIDDIDAFIDLEDQNSIITFVFIDQENKVASIDTDEHYVPQSDQVHFYLSEALAEGDPPAIKRDFIAASERLSRINRIEIGPIQAASLALAHSGVPSADCTDMIICLDKENPEPVWIVTTLCKTLLISSVDARTGQIVRQVSGEIEPA